MPRCPNGHDVAPEVAFCSSCGAAVTTTPVAPPLATQEASSEEPSSGVGSPAAGKSPLPWIIGGGVAAVVIIIIVVVVVVVTSGRSTSPALQSWWRTNGLSALGQTASDSVRLSQISNLTSPDEVQSICHSIWEDATTAEIFTPPDSRLRSTWNSDVGAVVSVSDICQYASDDDAEVVLSQAEKILNSELHLRNALNAAGLPAGNQ